MHRRRLLAATTAALGSPSLLAHTAAAQETREVRVALQFGITYLPLIVMREQRLLERHARAASLPEPAVTWVQISGGAAMNDALLAGGLDFAAAGVPPVVLLWARTRANLRVRAVASLGSLPLWLNTNNPEVRSIRDFTPRDRIALPAVKVSFQAVVLQMAAEQAFGPGQHARLDPLTVTLPHPDATAQMLAGRTEITAHFGSAPFQNQQLERPGIRRVLSSYEVTGRPHSSTLSTPPPASGTRIRAPCAPCRRAGGGRRLDRRQPARRPPSSTSGAERSPLGVDFVEACSPTPDHRFTVVPEGVLRFAEFQHRTGQVRERLDDWRELFFPEIHDKCGRLRWQPPRSRPRRRDPAPPHRLDRRGDRLRRCRLRARTRRAARAARPVRLRQVHACSRPSPASCRPRRAACSSTAGRCAARAATGWWCSRSSTSSCPGRPWPATSPIRCAWPGWHDEADRRTAALLDASGPRRLRASLPAHPLGRDEDARRPSPARWPPSRACC